MKLTALHLEDDDVDALFVQRTLDKSGLDVSVTHANSAEQFVAELEKTPFDIIMVDNGLPGFDGGRALQLAREKCPEVPFIFVSGAGDERHVAERLAAGATDYVLKGQLWQLPIAIRRARAGIPVAVTKSPLVASPDQARLQRHNEAMKRLVAAVQELSLARSLEAIQIIVRRAARELTGCDGATFILRDNGKCFYADEDAISPLWKGQRFPMSACISGWAMLNKQPAIIEDIYADPRIPAAAYRPTFVKSLVMVPIRTADPIGAIGNYWAEPHLATPEEVEVLQALANTTAVAMESVQLYADLEQRVQDRTFQLESANRELEAFSYSVSHDLQAPIRAISGFTQILAEDSAGQFNEKGTRYFGKILSETRRMGDLITDLLRLAKFARVELQRGDVDLSAMARDVADDLQSTSATPAQNGGTPARLSEFRIEDGLSVNGDAGLLRVVLGNLLSNAWKYSSKREHSVIEFSAKRQSDGTFAYFVRDNGAGFDMAYARHLFAPFQRLHRKEDFDGTGVGLATVQRIIHRHGGRLWAESVPDQGATFLFTLPQASASAPAPAN